MVLTFRADVEIRLYIHDAGEEFFLHYDFWPNAAHIVRDEITDMAVTKKLEIAEEDCRKENYSYFGNYQ